MVDYIIILPEDSFKYSSNQNKLPDPAELSLRVKRIDDLRPEYMYTIYLLNGNFFV